MRRRIAHRDDIAGIAGGFRLGFELKVRTLGGDFDGHHLPTHHRPHRLQPVGAKGASGRNSDPRPAPDHGRGRFRIRRGGGQGVDQRLDHRGGGNRFSREEIGHRQHAAHFQVQLHFCPYREPPVSGKFHPARPDSRAWRAPQGVRIEAKGTFRHRLAAVVQQLDAGLGQCAAHAIHQARGVDRYGNASDADCGNRRLRHGITSRQAAQFRRAEDPGKSRFRGGRQGSFPGGRGELRIDGRQIARLDPIGFRRHSQAAGHRQ